MSKVAIWLALALATLAPIAIAATSPFLAARSPAYIIGGFAGITALSILLIQPLLAAKALPLHPAKARRVHRTLGAALVILTALHIAGLYLTSPPDTLDALLLRSPTPFSVYGVIALGAVLATALLMALRTRLPRLGWAIAHNVLAIVIVIATAVHAVQIQGAMGTASKWIICGLTIITTVTVIFRIRILKPLAKRP
jgi:hypothetical protein